MKIVVFSIKLWTFMMGARTRIFFVVIMAGLIQFVLFCEAEKLLI